MLPNTKLIESYFLPPVAWFAQIIDAEELLLDIDSTYQKQSYRNRTYIKTSNGVLPLSVPIAGSQHLKMSETKIDYSQNWQTNYWRTIVSAYNKSPFFEYYLPDFEVVFFRKHENLYEFNEAFIKLSLKYLKINAKVTNYEGGEINSIIDKRGMILNKTKSPLLETNYRFEPYKQVFGEKFDENLSILDLLSCKGPEAKEVIKKTLIVS